MKRSVTKIVRFIVCMMLAVLSFIACHRSQPTWDAQILAPIVTANLSINDIVTSKYLNSNPDSSVSLVYIDSLYSNSLITIPDTTILTYTVSPLPATVINPGEIMFPSPSKTVTYPIGTVQLVKGVLQSGWLVYQIINPFPQKIDYYYKVSNVIKGVDTLEIWQPIPANTTLLDSIPLTGYTIDFTGPSHNGFNDITTVIQINLDPSASALTVKTFDTLIYAKITFRNVVPHYAKGYFGTDTSTYAAKVAFPVFNKIVSGSLNLQNVNMQFVLNNGIGVDARLTLNQLTSYRAGNPPVNLGAPGLTGSTININRATETGDPSSPVKIFSDTFKINPSNSNILSWLNNMPTSVGYNIHLETDPLGNVSGDNDFYYYGYGINANINIVIPLSLIANNLVLADTLSVNFAGSGNAGKQVKSGKLTIYASNGFPFSAGLQMYLLNSSNVVTDSIFLPNQTIAAGNVNPVSGKVTSPQSSVLTISLNEIQTQKLFNTKTMVLYAKFNMGSLPSTYRMIYNYYQLGLKVVGNFDYQVNG